MVMNSCDISYPQFFKQILATKATSGSHIQREDMNTQRKKNSSCTKPFCQNRFQNPEQRIFSLTTAFDIEYNEVI